MLHVHEGRTGVNFSWCVISWFYFPWNVNLGNFSSWFMTWRFCMTREELVNYYPILMILPLCSTWFWDPSLPNDLSHLSRVTQVYAICNMEPWISFSRFFFQTFFLVQEQVAKKSILLIFEIRENKLFISMMFNFFHSWTVPEIPLYDPLTCT